jgi:uncharacterized protein (TIGR02594 family)
VNITLYDIAERFIGIEEVPGKLSNPQILAMLQLDQSWPQDDEVDWCSAAMQYWTWLIRLPRSKSLMARSWLGVGEVVPIIEARRGFDVVVLWRGTRSGPFGHVGLYSGRSDDGSIALLGGNQGGMVNVSVFPMERVLGIRRLREE